MKEAESRQGRKYQVVSGVLVIYLEKKLRDLTESSFGEINYSCRSIFPLLTDALHCIFSK